MSDNLIINGDFSQGRGATATSVAGTPLTALSVVPGWELTTHSTASTGSIDVATYSMEQAIYEDLIAEPPAGLKSLGVFQIVADGYASASGNFARLDHYVAGAARALAGRYAEISFWIHAETRGVVKFSAPAVVTYDEGTAAELEACPDTVVNLEPGWNFVSKRFLVPTFPVLEEDVDEVIVPHYVASDFIVFNIYVDLHGSNIHLAQTDSVVLAAVSLKESVDSDSGASLARSQASLRKIVTYTIAEPTARVEDEYIMLDGVETITLPSLAEVPIGKEYLFKVLTGTPTIAAAGTEEIDGEVDITFAPTEQYKFVRIVAGEVEWHVVGGAIT